MKLVFTQTFLDSLEESFDFLAFELNLSREKQLEIHGRIFNAINRLKTNPNIGAQELHLSESKYKYRRIIEGHFKVIYRLESNIIYITDILTQDRIHLR